MGQTSNYLTDFVSLTAVNKHGFFLLYGEDCYATVLDFILVLRDAHKNLFYNLVVVNCFDA